MRNIFLGMVAFFASLIGMMGIAAFGLMIWDFMFPGTFKDWYLVRHGGLQTDLALLIMFGLQHSGMARKKFKEWWANLIPKELERSYYVMFSGFFLFLVSVMWTPVYPPLFDLWGTVWGYLLLGMAGLGLLIIVLSTFSRHGLELLGIPHIYFLGKGRQAPQNEFETTGLSRWVRHPLYLGMLLLFWFTPTMTADHVLFASVMSLYLRIGIQFEEADLLEEFGEAYRKYQEEVPMLFPWGKRGRRP